MTTDREVTRAVRSWLELGPTQLPERVLDAVLDQVPTVGQRRRPWLDRVSERPWIVGLAAAVTVAVVVVASVQPFRPPAGVSGLPSPIPSQAASPSPSPTIRPVPSEGPMSGRYVYNSISRIGIALEFTAPPDWSACCDGFTRHVDESTQFAPWVVDLVYPDPCDRSTPPTVVGPTVIGVVNALSEQPGRLPPRASPSAGPFQPDPVTVSGFSGLRMQLEVPLDTVFSECTDGMYTAWIGKAGPDETRFNQNPGQIDDLWILDVDGTPLTLLTSYQPTTSAARRAELEAIVASIVIRPAPRAPTPAPTQPPQPAPTEATIP